VFFGGFFCSWVLGFIRVLLLFGCLMGVCTVLGFGALEGFWGFLGSCWVLHFGLAGFFLCILPVY
jgi:hypothetical protein